jgi:hypothetical protein
MVASWAQDEWQKGRALGFLFGRLGFRSLTPLHCLFFLGMSRRPGPGQTPTARERPLIFVLPNLDPPRKPPAGEAQAVELIRLSGTALTGRSNPPAPNHQHGVQDVSGYQNPYPADAGAPFNSPSRRCHRVHGSDVDRFADAVAPIPLAGPTVSSTGEPTRTSAAVAPLRRKLRRRRGR